MTKRERAKVATLLKCGADLRSLVGAGYAVGACDGIAPCSKVYAYACDALDSVRKTTTYKARQGDCLEAAARVEEGLWP